MIDLEQIRPLLEELIDPVQQKSLLASRQIKGLRIAGSRVIVDLQMGYPDREHASRLVELVRARLSTAPGVTGLEIDVQPGIVAHTVQRGLKPLPNVKNIIAVASGKGGVGKSTTTANLALALAAEGARVGVLDADIYGPSQPTLLGVGGKPESLDDKTMRPLIAHGLQVMSIGFLIEADAPTIWRGPMVSGALEQLLRQTNWQDLDYLFVDLPPGTGDIQLTLGQKVPLTGAVLVTTPQDLALIDARKGLKMFEKIGVEILGVVENMALHVCSNCGHAEAIFGTGGGASLARDHAVELLGSLPLDLRIREHADAGRPTVVADPDGTLAGHYRAMARRLGVRIAGLGRDMSAKFPAIVVQPNP
ncbi:MAG: iron-sulfur cluster carrier protein ApbC [Burkholderiaceae bacterium]|jgi:ATP-binding protein involved in chromosome partitioning